MNCQRCNIPHKPDYQLVSTEQGLLCPACVRVSEATLAVRGSLGLTLFDEDLRVIIDPMYNPYEEAQTYAHPRNFMREAYGAALRDLIRPVIDAEKPESSSRYTLNTLALYGLEDQFKRTLEETGRLRYKPQVKWEEDNG